MAVTINIFKKLDGKWLYKSVKLIVFGLVLPVIFAILLLFLFRYNQLISMLKILN